jgi:hypothetical protein
MTKSVPDDRVRGLIRVLAGNGAPQDAQMWAAAFMDTRQALRELLAARAVIDAAAMHDATYDEPGTMRSRPPTAANLHRALAAYDAALAGGAADEAKEAQ